MRNGLFIIAILLAAAALPRAAEAQNVIGDVFRLKGGPCTARAGAGTPEGVVPGVTCDTYENKTTGQIYKKIGTGTTGWYPVLGPSAATCTTFASCVAQSLSTDFLSWTQKLRTDPNTQFRSVITAAGHRLESYDGSGWRPFILGGAPTRVMGGGFHVGSSNIIDPGLGNMQVDGFLGKPGYVSQLNGWRIDALGAADFRYIFTDELHAKSFIADLEQALAGGQIIAKSVSVVGAAFTAPAAGAAATLTVRDLPSAPGMAVFQAGDHVRLREFSRSGGSLTIADAWGVVTAHLNIGNGLQTWTFTRGSGVCSGAMTAGTVVQPDAILIDYGVSGNGFYEVSAIDGLYGVNSPYAQIATWSGDCPIAANTTLRTRFGNLRGITGVTGEFGIIAGTYAATAGQYVRASSQAFEMHGMNFSLWKDATKVIELNRTAPSIALGATLPSAYGSGTGVWMGMDAGAAKFRVGVPGGAGVFWDGTNLNVSGTITVTGGNAAKTDFTNVTAGYAGSATVGGNANDTAAVNGVAAATVQGGAARANLGLNSTGVLVTKVIPASAVAPGGAGLYLGSDFLGYYNGAAWRTYMDNAGNFYLGGTSGALQWNAGLGTLTISGTLSGPGSGITSITGGNIQTGTVTATQIASGTITSTQIAAGTIVAGNIAANTITADKLNVTSLSAITATMGALTVNADLTMSTGKVVGGYYQLRQDGLYLSNSELTEASINWEGGAQVNGGGVRMRLRGPGSTWSQINLNNSTIFFWAGITADGPSRVFIDGNGLGTEAGADLGTAGFPFGTLRLTGNVIVSGQIGATTSFGVNDNACAGTLRRSLFFQNGILYSSPCQ